MLRFDAVPELVKDQLDELSSRGLNEFALGGGTSLALRMGHRISVDLDFFTEAVFSPEELFEEIALADATIIKNARNTLALNANGVKVEFLRHAYPVLAPVENMDGIRMLSLPDVAAMKLKAIANRGSKKDFYDVVELLEHHTLPQLLDFFASKYRASDPFTVIRSLVWFEDAEQEPDPVSMAGKTWEDVKARVIAAMGDLI